MVCHRLGVVADGGQTEFPFLHPPVSRGRTLSCITDSSLKEARPGWTDSHLENMSVCAAVSTSHFPEQRTPLSYSGAPATAGQEVTALPEKLLGLEAKCPCARGTHTCKRDVSQCKPRNVGTVFSFCNSIAWSTNWHRRIRADREAAESKPLAWQILRPGAGVRVLMLKP